MIDQNPRSERARQLLAICGAGTPEEVLADLDAKRPSPPPLEARTLRALQLAADDAARQEQSSVRTDNLLVGVLRLSRGAFADVVRSAGTDMAKLEAMLGSRTMPGTDPFLGAELPRDGAAEEALQTAIAEADTRRREVVMPLHLLLGILRQRTAPGAILLRDAGANDVRLTELLDGSVYLDSLTPRFASAGPF